MDAIELFAAQLLLSLLLSVAILLRLQSLLRRIGGQVCERGGVATEFWISYTQLMMIIAPLTLVAWFASPSYYAPAAEQLRSALATVLSGQFLGLALVGRAVWKAFVRAQEPAKPAPAANPAILASQAA